MAKLTGDLHGVPNGEVYPRTFAAGEDCPPELEEAARALRVLDAPDPSAPTTKAKGAAPENKGA